MTTPITRTLAQFRAEYAVYQLDVADMPFYIGCAPLCDVYRFPDAHSNSEYLNLPPDTVVSASVLFIGGFEEARSRASFHVQERRAYANLNGVTLGPPTRRRASGPVRCLETGQTWPTAAAAATAAGVTAQAMSAHLNRRPSALSVAGRTYERIDQ